MKNLIILLTVIILIIPNKKEKTISIYFPNSLVYINTTTMNVEFENLDTVLSFQTWDELDNYISHLSVKEIVLDELLPEDLYIYDQVLVEDSIPVYQNASSWFDPYCWEWIQVGIIITKEGYLNYQFINYKNSNHENR